MFSLKMIQFDTSGWHVLKNNPDSKIWVVEPELLVEQALFPVTDYRKDLRDPEAFRADMETITHEMGGAVIDFNVATFAGVAGFTIISKNWINNSSEDMRKVYAGNVSFPLKDGCFQIKVMGLEKGTTGVRESVVATALHAQGKLSLPKGNAPAAPPDKTLGQSIKEQPMVRAPADDAEYDKDFPVHPLSRVRATLLKIKESLSFDPAVKNAPPYRVADSVSK